MKSKLHLIRHGTTEGNKKKWYYGETDLPILQEGIDSLKEMKEAGIYPHINGSFFTSGMKRTNQTLEVIYGDVDFVVVEDLQEMKFGKIEAKTYEEIREDEDFIKWIEDETGDIHIPGGDSKNSFRNRIRAGLEHIINLHRIEELRLRHREEAESLCVCHGGVIGGLMLELFPQDRDFFSWIPDQGRGFTLILDDGKVVDYREL